MDSTDYQTFLDELTSRLAADPVVVGLVALGSTADDAGRDRWSDHDFWVVTSAGSQSKYLDTFSWLPRADDILMTVRHGASYRGVLYGNGHKAEYAVFAPDEAVRGKIERYRVLIDRGGVETLAASIQSQTLEERGSALDRPDMLENLCVLLWSAHEKWERGERLSAQRYVQFSLDVFLNLLAARGRLKPSRAADKLDPRRRLEQTEPELARELGRLATLVPAEGGVRLFELAEKVLRPGAPELAWDKVMTVKAWLQEESGDAG